MNRRKHAPSSDDVAEWAPSPDVTWRDAPGELLLFDAAADTYHVLNPSAAAIWRLVASGATVARVAAQLSDRHGVPRKQMEADVSACVADLAARGVLIRKPPA